MAIKLPFVLLVCLPLAAQQSTPPVKQTPYAGSSTGQATPSPTVANSICSVSDGVRTYTVPCTNVNSVTPGANVSCTPNVGGICKGDVTISSTPGLTQNYANLGGVLTWANCTYSSGVCTTTGTVASVTISAIPGTYLKLIVDSDTSTTNSGGADIAVQFNSDTGSNYGWSGIFNNSGASAAAPTGGSGNNVTSAHVCATGTTTATETGGGTFYVVNYAGANWKFIEGHCQNYSSTSSFQGSFGGFWKGTAAITSITLFPSSGSFQTGSKFIISATN